MHFRFCCTCDDEEKVKNVENREDCSQTIQPPSTILPTTTPSPAVITQQPKNVLEHIQLDRITEVSSEGSSVEVVEEERPAPMLQQIKQKPPIEESQVQPLPILAPSPGIIELKEDTPSPNQQQGIPEIQPSNSSEYDKLYNKLLNLFHARAEESRQQYIPPVIEPEVPKITANTMIGEDELFLSQLAPNIFQGTFKGSQFHIINGKMIDDQSAFNESDKAAIKLAYDRIVEAIERGMKELSVNTNALSGQGQQEWNARPGTTINTNYINRRGENVKMTFKPIGEGHYQSSYEGKEFMVLNGRLLAQDGYFDEEDTKLILQTFNNTLMGMEQGLMGMQRMQTRVRDIGGSAFAGTSVQGGMVRSAAVGGNATAYVTSGSGGSAYARAVGADAVAHSRVDDTTSSFNVLATGRDTLQRMRSLNHGKRISVLESELLAPPRQAVMIIEDITQQTKKPRYFDDVDQGNLAEPVLQKTTFTPQAIIYDDPKTYESQDKNELPLAKPLDDLIISVDENFNSENRYHFHQARPLRVTRTKLNPKEKFRLASPERYSLFEAECLKLHNQYRKMHGVPPLVHNEFLSQVAKEWAEHLALKDAFYHRPKNEYGENLYYVEGMPCRARMAVKAWYDEIDLYDYDNPKFSKEVGHFTQLVWKDTREVGTGVAQIGDKVWVCCNYHPPGNYSDKMNDEFVPRPLMKRRAE